MTMPAKQKDNRQPILFLDYLMGNVRPSNPNWDLYTQMVQGISSIAEIHDGGLHIVKDNIHITAHGETIPLFAPALLEQDVGLKHLCGGFVRFKKNKDSKVYVISKNLGIALKNSKYDIPMQNVPKNFLAFVVLPDVFQKKYYGSFVYTYVIDGEPCICLTSLNYEPHPTVPDDKILANGFHSLCLREVKYSEEASRVKELPVSQGASIEVTSEDEVYFKTLLNAIIYIANSDEALVEEINEFSPKKSKREGEKRNYTSLPYIRVGVNFNLPRNYTKEFCLVSGHFKWQHHGPGNSLLKYIFRESYVRTLKGVNNE